MNNVPIPIPPDALFIKEVQIGDNLCSLYYHIYNGLIIEKDRLVIKQNVKTGEVRVKKEWSNYISPTGIRVMSQPAGLPPGRPRWIDLNNTAYVWYARVNDNHPCWVTDEEIYDLVTGKLIGVILSPPSITGYVGVGPHLHDYPEPHVIHRNWLYRAAPYEEWYKKWGVDTVLGDCCPTPDELQYNIETRKVDFYHVYAHGGPNSFLFKYEIKDDGIYNYHISASNFIPWMENRDPITFAFFGHCDAMAGNLDTPGTWSHVFRKGSYNNTVTIGYWEMHLHRDAWLYSWSWKEALHAYVDGGMTFFDAFMEAYKDYPEVCVETDDDNVPIKIGRFAGDKNLALSGPKNGIGTIPVYLGPGDKQTVYIDIVPTSLGEYSVQMGDMNKKFTVSDTVAKRIRFDLMDYYRDNFGTSGVMDSSSLVNITEDNMTSTTPPGFDSPPHENEVSAAYYEYMDYPIREALITYYRDNYGTPGVMDTYSVLGAIDDYSWQVVVPGFEYPVTWQEYHVISDEWLAS